ncbi:MAG TPA: PAS domain S-box protein [Myxococcales bacterium]|nr:PAS domain S-box protein [Myxococcales bacterium]
MPQTSAFLEKLFEYSIDGVIHATPEGDILRANPAACRALGRNEEELRRLRRRDIVVQDDALHDFLGRRAACGSTQGEINLRRPDGSTFPVECTSGLIPADGSTFAYIIFRDVTESRTTKDRLRRSNRALRMLTLCNQAVSRCATEAALLAEVCKVVVEAGGYRMCWVGLAENDERKTVRPVAHAGHVDGYLDLMDVVWSDAPNGEGPVGTAVRTGRPDVNRDFHTDPHLQFWRAEAEKRGYRTVSGLPLTYHGQPLGVIAFYSASLETFDKEELDILDELTTELSLGIHTLRTRAAKTQAEEALARQQRLLADVIDGAPSVILAFDREGRISLANAAAERVFGHPRQELIGHRAEEFVPGEHIASYARQRAEVLESGKPQSGEIEVRLESGASTMLASRYPLRDVTGAIYGTVSVSTDITETKQAERALRESEARYRLLMELSPEGIFVTDPQGRLLEANLAGERMLGYSPVELRSMTVRDLIVPDEVPRLAPEVPKLAGGEIVQGAWTLRRKDGSLLPAEVSGRRLPDGRLQSVVRDISARVQAERALRETEARFRQLAENIREVFWLTDTAKNEMLYVSTGYQEIWGRSVDELMRHPSSWLENIVPEDRPRVVAALPGQSRGEYDLVYRILRPDGETRWIRDRAFPIYAASGEVTRVAGIAEDITALKLAERATLAQERRFRSLIENALDLIAVVDAQARFQILSASVEPILGVPPRELIGQSLLDLVHPDDRGRIEGTFAAGVPRVTTPFEARVRHRDGGWRIVEGSIRNLLDDPDVAGVVINGRDITGRRDLEEQLRQSQKLEAIGSLAGGVAHDFNNLLSVILGYVGLLRTHATSCDGVAELGEIGTAAERAAQLTRQLLAFGRRQILQPQVVDLNQIVGGMERMLGRLIGEDVELQWTPAPAPARAFVDPGQIEQVIMNLAVNARDAMPRGGRLSIAAAEDAGRVTLTVTDTGVGMSPEVQARIFEPFFTTKEKGRGTGLGLSTVIGIVEQSGGAISVQSEPGRGSSFCISLPASSGPVVTRQPPSLAQPAGGNETVLVVEDQQELRRLICTVLAGSGYRVVQARSGAEAVRLLESEAGPVHLLLTDVVMPQMGGPAVAAEVLRLRPQARVVYMSGYTDDAVVRHGVEASRVAFMQKPFSPASLLATIREVLDQPAPVPTPRPPAARARLLLLDDEPVMRRLVKMVLAAHEVVALDDGNEALARIGGGERFDGILCDLGMEKLGGIEFFAMLQQRDAAAAGRVLFLTGGATTDRARDFLEQHAGRVLRKPVANDTLRAAVAALLSRS